MVQLQEPQKRRVLLGMTFVILVATAFLRGNYLLGVVCGTLYAVVMAAVLWLALKRQHGDSWLAKLQMQSRRVFAAIVVFVMICPTMVSPRLQFEIEELQLVRTIQREFKQVSTRDVEFSKLAISTKRSKGLNVTISGTMPSKQQLHRLRSRIADDCPVIESCPIHWRIRFQNTSEDIDVSDWELFPDRRESA